MLPGAVIGEQLYITMLPGVLVQGGTFLDLQPSAKAFQVG